MIYINNKTKERIVAEQEFIDALSDKVDWVIEVLAIEPIIVQTLDELKSTKNQQLKQWHDAQTNGMKAKYSQSEVDSFLDKRNEAMAWRVDNTVATPYVTAMSGGNEEVRLMLLNAVLVKVDATAQLEAYVLMKRDAIEACTTQEELEAIVW